MNRLIEIHDSILGGIAIQGSTVEVHLAPAYVHVSDGRPGVDAGTGWTQQAVLRIRHARIERSPTGFPVELMDGHLDLGGIRHDNMIPIPLGVSGHVELQADGPNGQVLRVSGDGVELEMIGSPTYVEEFSS